MERIDKLAEHLLAPNPVLAAAASTAAVRPTVVTDAQGRMSSDPIQFLIETGREHPGCFMLERSKRNKFVVVSDVELFEDVLTFEDHFGMPYMNVNNGVFKIPDEHVDKYDHKAISTLRQLILTNNDKYADKVASLVSQRIDSSAALGEAGVMDLRELGTNLFWPMTEVLFGEGASEHNAPYLKAAFDDVDSNLLRALGGKVDPKLTAGVDRASHRFAIMVADSKKPNGGGCPIGPVMQLYDRVTEHTDPVLTAKFATAVWWGGQGNALPSTMWTFGMILAHPEVKRKVLSEVRDGAFKNQPNAKGEFDYTTLPYLTAALKETLRLRAYTVANRAVKKDCTLYSPLANKTFQLVEGDQITLHFGTRHLDERIYPDPHEFRPERFLGTGAGLSPTINGHKYAFAPFSAGLRKCAGFSFAMLEIPVVVALFLRHYDMELLDPLPGVTLTDNIGVLKPDGKPARIQYKRLR